MDKERLKSKFPAYFPLDQLPEGAKEEAIHVYRICKWGKIEARAFRTSYEEQIHERMQLKEMNESSPDIDACSVSCFEKINDARRMLKFFSKNYPQPVIAEGSTAILYGLSQRTKDRKRNAKSHVDWWTYVGVEENISKIFSIWEEG